MYRRMVEICSPPKRVPGPGIDPDTLCTHHVLQEECLGHITAVSRRKFSHYISELMDILGYSYDMIKNRQHTFDSSDQAVNGYQDECKCVTTGGKGEGTALYFESDRDLMTVIHNIICTDNQSKFINRQNLNLFYTERSETSPGYTRLKLLKLENTSHMNFIKQSLFVAEDGMYYLSSRFFTEAIAAEKGLLDFKEISGPSLPVAYYFTDNDFVIGFTCNCPDLLDNWVMRRRLHGWPSPHIINDVSHLDGHVVPVGFKGSDEMYREWRICFTFAELHLIRNFNDTQLKVYILLKKICKSVLKPVCEDMTSYIMKNVVFWVCEEKGIQQFTRNMLMDRLFDCIIYLRTCVVKNSLPSYMIPERNLFAARLDIQQRKQLTTLLGNLLHEEGRMLLRCEQLRDAMTVLYITPDMCREFSEKRDKIEYLWLISHKTMSELVRPGMCLEETRSHISQKEQINDIMCHIASLIQFDIPSLKQAGKTQDEINKLFYTRVIRMLM